MNKVSLVVANQGYQSLTTEAILFFLITILNKNF